MSRHVLNNIPNQEPNAHWIKRMQSQRTLPKSAGQFRTTEIRSNNFHHYHDHVGTISAVDHQITINAQICRA